MGEILSAAGHLAGVIVRKVGLTDLYTGFRAGADVPQEEEAEGGWLDAMTLLMEHIPSVLEAIKEAQAGSRAASASGAPAASASGPPAGGDGPGLHAVPDPDVFNDEVKIRWSTSGAAPMATAVYEPLDLRAEGPNLRTVLRDIANQLDVSAAAARNGAEGAARGAPATPAA